MKRFLALCLITVLALVPATPALARGKKSHKTAKGSELYQRLGQRKGIQKVVDNFVGRCAADDRIKDFFKKAAKSEKRLAKFKKNLTDQICEAVGGPCKYRGLSMRKAHRGMHVREEHFDVLVEHLATALDEGGVAPEDKQAILAKLGPMKSQIVETKRDTASKKSRKKR